MPANEPMEPISRVVRRVLPAGHRSPPPTTGPKKPDARPSAKPSTPLSQARLRRSSHAPLSSQDSQDSQDSQHHQNSRDSQDDALRYRCSGCHDLGWVRRFLGPEDWRTELVRCPCRQDEAKRQAWERARRASDLASQLYSRTFDNFATTHNADASYHVAQWADDPTGWITLAGTPGTGKTHLLAAAFNQLVAHGQCPLYVLCPNLMDFIRDGYQSGDYGDRFWSVRKAPILLLDDLGAELRTPWSEQALFMLLDHRYAHQLPTLIATNVPLPELEPRIASRVQDVTLGRVCILKGPDYRSVPRR